MADDAATLAAKSDPTTQPIVRRTLHDELLDRLRQMIVEGELAPATKVPEKVLCDRFGVLSDVTGFGAVLGGH